MYSNWCWDAGDGTLKNTRYFSKRIDIKSTSDNRKFHVKKRKGQRFSFLFEPPKGGMGDFCKISTDL